MPFPYSYKRTIAFSNERLLSSNINKNYILSLIGIAIKKKKPISIEENNQKLSFAFLSPVFRFSYSTDLEVLISKDELKINYEVNLEKLIRIILVVIILTAFFSFLSVKYFLITSGLISFALFLISYLTIDNLLVNLIEGALKGIIVKEDSVEKISEEQSAWINDENVCSACGNQLSEFDLQCPECGIKLKRNRHSIPLDVSKYKDKKITYHIKK